MLATEWVHSNYLYSSGGMSVLMQPATSPDGATTPTMKSTSLPTPGGYDLTLDYGFTTSPTAVSLQAFGASPLRAVSVEAVLAVAGALMASIWARGPADSITRVAPWGGRLPRGHEMVKEASRPRNSAGSLLYWQTTVDSSFMALTKRGTCGIIRSAVEKQPLQALTEESRRGDDLREAGSQVGAANPVGLKLVEVPS